MKTLKAPLLLALATIVMGCNEAYGKPAEPTAIDFGDSVSLPMAGRARLILDGQVDFRHDPWDKGDIEPHDNNYYYGTVQDHGQNNGSTSTLLAAMTKQLTGDKYYTVLLFNSGIHDLQHGRSCAAESRVSLDSYRSNLESISSLVQKHAQYVIWIDTTHIAANSMCNVPAGSEAAYNHVAHGVAKEHGFYILDTSGLKPNARGIHLTSASYRKFGEMVSQCVLTALKGKETAYCHH